MARSKVPPRRVISKRVSRGLTTALEMAYVERAALAHQPPTEVFTSEGEVRAEVLHLSRPISRRALTTDTKRTGERHKPPHTHVIFLPGNPGVIEYYRPLLRQIYDRLPRDVADNVSIHGIGLPGHDLRELNGTQTFNIAEHVAFCKSYLASGRLEPPLRDSRLLVVGHSYGSYLGVRLLEELGESAIRRAGMTLLMPALWEMGVCAGALTRFATRDRLGSTTWAAWALTAVVPPVLRDVIVMALGHDSNVESVTRALVDGRRRGLYLNICHLVRDEVICIKDPTRHAWCTGIGERSMLVCAEGDKWCPEEGRLRIQKAFGEGLRVEPAGEGVHHSFVLSRVQTEKVARLIAPWICERVREDVPVRVTLE